MHRSINYCNATKHPHIAEFRCLFGVSSPPHLHVMSLVLLNKLLSKLHPKPPSQNRGSRPRPVAGNVKKINLALQGGGAHGAFTWGVLDQLLADGRVAIDGISGSSAGALNAVMLADGLARGGPEAAQRCLAEFWRAASFDGNLPDVQRAVVERFFSFLPCNDSPMPWLGAMSRFWSPYDLNPLKINPLKDLIERFVDFELIRAGRGDLFISATNVLSGALRVFPRAEITAEVVMASACLPLLFHAVEIDGVPYWDGGYSGNPVLLPYLQSSGSRDVLIVQINPIERHKTPTTAREIMSRVNEITFNASLLAELRAVELAGSLIDEAGLAGGQSGGYRRLRLHRIVMDAGAADLGTKFNTDFDFFSLLHKRGQRAARRFLDAHFEDIGRRSTIDVGVAAAAEVG
jgi:NTE family protein